MVRKGTKPHEKQLMKKSTTLARKIIRNTVIFIIYREFTAIFLGIGAKADFQFDSFCCSLAPFHRNFMRSFLQLKYARPKTLISFVIYVVVRSTIISFIILWIHLKRCGCRIFALQTLPFTTWTFFFQNKEKKKNLIKCAHYPLISSHKKNTIGKIYFLGHNFLLRSYLLRET